MLTFVLCGKSGVISQQLEMCCLAKLKTCLNLCQSCNFHPPSLSSPRKMKKWFCDWTVLVISEATHSCVTRSRYHWQQFPEYVCLTNWRRPRRSLRCKWLLKCGCSLTVIPGRNSILTMDRHLSFIVVEAYGSTVESLARDKYVLH